MFEHNKTSRDIEQRQLDGNVLHSKYPSSITLNLNNYLTSLSHSSNPHNFLQHRI